MIKSLPGFTQPATKLIKEREELAAIKIDRSLPGQNEHTITGKIKKHAMKIYHRHQDLSPPVTNQFY